MIDSDGYRPCVCIVICNDRNQVFWGRRIGEMAWQFPQGGIKQGELPEEAMYRELTEETGLRAEHVRLIGKTKDWLHYDVPNNWVRREWRGVYKGQKQIWFLLRMVGHDSDVCLSHTDHPEFDSWCWHDYWVPINSVIRFKRNVYRQALNELAPKLSEDRLTSPAA